MKSMTFREGMDIAKENAAYNLRCQATKAANKGDNARAQELRARALFLETGKEVTGDTPTLG